MRIPVTRNFSSDTLIGHIAVVDELIPVPDKLHEYFLAPAYRKDEATGKVKIDQYALVHRSQLPTDEQMKKREKELGI